MARAMWKGVIRFGDQRVPVKLYAATEDRTVRFRLLHRKDQAPVTQAMVNPNDDRVVAYEDVRRAYVTSDRDLVVLDDDELASLEPEASRDIEILQLLPPAAIDHRWYQRPYYLGPDGSDAGYAAFARALADSGREALVRWVMRKKEYLGALRLEAGYLMLMSLRYADEVVSAEELDAPSGPKLNDKELDMARQLVEMLTDEFDPEQYSDQYRARVEELIETKARGGTVRRKPPARRPATADLTAALEASLKQERKRA
ncbi:MAG TPA: Ku protein [Pseudomonadales bacterium]